MMDAPLHIGFLTCDLTHRHGWAHYGLSLARALMRAGVQVTVIASRRSPLPDDVPALRLLPDVDPMTRGLLARSLALVPKAHSALRACHVIHAALEPYAPLAARIAGSRPLIVTGHGSYVRAVERPFPAGVVFRQAFSRALLVCVSRYTAQVAAGLMPELRTAVVNNGVDIERFQNLPPAPQVKRVPRVLSVGAVKARKGTLALVRAMRPVVDALPEAECIIIGALDAEPDYTEQVRREIAALGLNDHVHLMGRLSDAEMRAWYSAADVFVLPSLNIGWKFEGYGLALIEASAAGLPVIGTRGCGAEDAVDDGVTGLLVDQAQVERELVEAILRLLNDPAERRRMGTAGQAKAAANTWDHTAQRMIALYRGELDRAGHP